MMMDNPQNEKNETEPLEGELQARRDVLVRLGKWSMAVAGGVALAGLFGHAKKAEAAGAWANRRGIGGGAWANARVGIGGGGAWVNGGGGGGGWVNRRGGGGAWVNYR